MAPSVLGSLTSNASLESFNAMTAEDIPHLEGPEAPPKGQLPVAVVDDCRQREH